MAMSYISKNLFKPSAPLMIVAQGILGLLYSHGLVMAGGVLRPPQRHRFRRFSYPEQIFM